MSSISDDLANKAREREEKTRLSDHGMAMDPQEIPHGADNDPDDDGGEITPAHHDR